MKAYSKQNEEFATETEFYDAFVNYLDSVYFPGASEVLEPGLIEFEYANYKSSYAH